MWKAICKRPINIICISLSLFIYFLNRMVLQSVFNGSLGYFCKCYLNDLVCPLFFLAFSEIMLIWIDHELLRLRWILLLGMAAGFIWEVIGPIINKKSVGDYLDFVCYVAGTLLYYCIFRLGRRDSQKGGEYEKEI